MDQSGAAMFALEVSIKPRFGDDAVDPNIVYFARVDPDGSFLQAKFIRSKYARDGRAYPLNAAPGTYLTRKVLFPPGRQTFL